MENIKNKSSEEINSLQNSRQVFMITLNGYLADHRSEITAKSHGMIFEQAVSLAEEKSGQTVDTLWPGTRAILRKWELSSPLTIIKMVQKA
jgi:hypothetical protein